MAASFDLTRYLGTLPLFAELREEDRQTLALQGCRLSRPTRGDRLFAAGHRCDEMLVVVTGHVKLYGLTPAGGEKVFELIGPGQCIGETLVFHGQPHSLHAQALTDLLLLHLPKAPLTALVAREPRFALRLLAGASQRIQDLLQDVEAYCLHSGVRRVVGYLLSRPEARGGQRGTAPVVVSLPVSKATIASRLSLTPEYFSRVLRELEDAGLIETRRRDIHILQPQGLARYCSA
ncbi:Crp/Fnr family transcriptional regulator [Pelomonas sp. CA6]|uniref:Crp/Fnr family transcriptional regulator n=1 Tax=Pelomonas sp. CA6 TaxID=2907999 RepID=UPI001F4B3473|nr:Crp/Fnr family transcriptional regulator [Pelomonas sp. CA6]MCH7341794.1 Crp/Fnr family transcriptional regulator [Pelomonas sp. CA6]